LADLVGVVGPRSGSRELTFGRKDAKDIKDPKDGKDDASGFSHG
jgi:hypothetical protein